MGPTPVIRLRPCADWTLQTSSAFVEDAVNCWELSSGNPVGGAEQPEAQSAHHTKLTEHRTLKYSPHDVPRHGLAVAKRCVVPGCLRTSELVLEGLQDGGQSPPFVTEQLSARWVGYSFQAAPQVSQLATARHPKTVLEADRLCSKLQSLSPKPWSLTVCFTECCVDCSSSHRSRRHNCTCP